MTGAAAGAQQGAGGGESPAPPDPFVVTTGSGLRLTAAPARIDIKYRDPAQPPEIELFISALDASNRTWTALAAAPADFLETSSLSATVVDRPLQPGEASVSMGVAGGDASFGQAGLVELRLQGGRLVGEARGMNEQISAIFEGPIVVTCAVPPTAMPASSADPPTGGEASVLVVDERFESELCRRHAALARSLQQKPSKN